MLLTAGGWRCSDHEDRFHDPMSRWRLVEVTGRITLVAVVDLGEPQDEQISMLLVEPTLKCIEQLSGYCVDDIAILRAPQGKNNRPSFEWLVKLTVVSAEKFSPIITAHTDDGRIYQHALGEWWTPEQNNTLWAATAA